MTNRSFLIVCILTACSNGVAVKRDLTRVEISVPSFDAEELTTQISLGVGEQNLLQRTVCEKRTNNLMRAPERWFEQLANAKFISQPGVLDMHGDDKRYQGRFRRGAIYGDVIGVLQENCWRFTVRIQVAKHAESPASWKVGSCVADCSILELPMYLRNRRFNFPIGNYNDIDPF